MKFGATILGVFLLCAGVAVAGGDPDEPGTLPARCVDGKQQTGNENKRPLVDPANIVAGFYAGQSLGFNWDDDTFSPARQISKRLSAVFTQSQRDYGQFALTFDPVVNGQDALIEDLVVHPALIDGDHAYVTVRFRNFDTDNALVYSFVCEDQAWRLDEIASIGGQTRWVLSEVLQNP